jgi:hypothetical protein
MKLRIIGKLGFGILATTRCPKLIGCNKKKIEVNLKAFATLKK